MRMTVSIVWSQDFLATDPDVPGSLLEWKSNCSGSRNSGLTAVGDPLR
jgi:hypothetical protein